MERYYMFLGRKNQYCKNDYTTKHNVRFNVIPIKLPMAFFTSVQDYWRNHGFDYMDPYQQSDASPF